MRMLLAFQRQGGLHRQLRPDQFVKADTATFGDRTYTYSCRAKLDSL